MLSRVLIKTGTPEALGEAQKLQSRAEDAILRLCDKYDIGIPPEEEWDEDWYDTFVIAWHR